MKMRLEYLAIPISAILVTAIIDALFPGILHRAFRIALNIISAAIAAMFIFTNTVFMSRSIDFIYPIYMVAILYFAVRFAIKLRKINLPQGIFLFGIGFFLYTTLREFMWRQDIILLPPFEGESMMRMGESVAIATMLSVLVFSYCMAVSVFISARNELDLAKYRYREKELESENQRKYNLMKSEHIATITHETATPLTVLSRYAEFLADELRKMDFGEKSEAMAHELDTMSFEAIRVSELIDLLNKDMEKYEFGAKTDINLYDLIENITRLYKPTFERIGTALTSDIPNNLPNIYANPGEITQVFFNILQNAKKHTANGTVIITAKTAEIKENFIEVSISDTGGGIPHDKIHQILTRGVGYDSDSGLGLAICNDIIKSMGGRLLIESEVGKGTMVSFSLPIWKGVEHE